jgi:uncharacterized membrane protein
VYIVLEVSKRKVIFFGQETGGVVGTRLGTGLIGIVINGVFGGLVGTRVGEIVGRGQLHVRDSGHDASLQTPLVSG